MKEIPIGSFDDVAGLLVSDDNIAIRDKRRCEILIPYVPQFDRQKQKYTPVEVRGTFGDFSKPEAGADYATGIHPRGVQAIEIEFDLDFDTFVTRILRVTTPDAKLRWELICVK